MLNLKRYLFTIALSIIANFVLIVLFVSLMAMNDAPASPNIVPIMAGIDLVVIIAVIIGYKLSNKDLSIWIVIATFMIPYYLLWTGIFNQIKVVKLQDEKTAKQIQKDKPYIISISNFSNASAILSERASRNIFYISLPVNFSDKFTDQQVSNTLKFDIKFGGSNSCHFNNIQFRVNRYEPYDKIITNPAGKYVFKYDYSSSYLDDSCINSIKNNKDNVNIQITELNPNGDGKDILFKEVPLEVEIK